MKPVAWIVRALLRQIAQGRVSALELVDLRRGEFECTLAHAHRCIRGRRSKGDGLTGRNRRDAMLRNGRAKLCPGRRRAERKGAGKRPGHQITSADTAFYYGVRVLCVGLVAHVGVLKMVVRVREKSRRIVLGSETILRLQR